MKSDFYKIYEKLYFDYLFDLEFRRRRLYPFDERNIIRNIRVSIEKADKENVLRPDAKYFLIVNFHQLIIRPLFEQNPFNKSFPAIVDAIEADISTIVTDTIKEAGQGQISGHQIIHTIDGLWRTLRTTRLDLWG